MTTWSLIFVCMALTAEYSHYSLLGCLKWRFKNIMVPKFRSPLNVKSQWQCENMWAFHFQKWTQENLRGQWVFSIQESAYKYSFQTANQANSTIFVAWFHLVQNVIFKFKLTVHLRCSDICKILMKTCRQKTRFKPSSFQQICVTNRTWVKSHARDLFCPHL